LLAVDTCKRYVATPFAVLHVNVGGTDMFIEALAGDVSVGVEGTTTK